MENNFQQPVLPSPLSQPIIQQPVNQQPPIDKVSSGSKWKWILLIVILLLIVGGGAYAFGTKQNKVIVQNSQKTITPTMTQSSPTPTPDPTANWKTYTINKNSYIDFNCSFKYPANFSIENTLDKIPNYNNQSTWGRVSLVTTESRHIFEVNFYDSLATLKGTYPNPEVKNENIKTLDGVYAASESYKNIGTENIGGIKFNKYFQPLSSADIIYAAESNGHIIEISTQPLVKNSDGTIRPNTDLTLSGQATDKLDDINQQILSTFKFTN